MPEPFYNRLKKYYEKVGEVLRGEAESSSIFPNPSDIGQARELIYAEFLKQHVPSKCNVYLGGFLFDQNGVESRQIDVIISTDTAPKFNFPDKGVIGKSFGPVEGCLGVASIKSKLDKKELSDSLDLIASIPPTESLKGRVNPNLQIKEYEDWPYKIIYASDSLSINTILKHVEDYYKTNPDIPIHRRPDIIHVVGKFVFIRYKKWMKYSKPDGSDEPLEEGTFLFIEENPDVQAIIWVLDQLQKKASTTNHISFNYGKIINKINELL